MSELTGPPSLRSTPWRWPGWPPTRGDRSLRHPPRGGPALGARSRRRPGSRKAALERDTIGYTNAPGLLSLREAIAGHYADWYGVDVDPAHIVVTAGASAGFTLAFLACFEPGQRVGVVEPGYPCYRNTLRALGVEPVAIPVGPDTRWAPTPERGRRPRGRSTAWWWPARPIPRVPCCRPSASPPSSTGAGRTACARVRRDLPRHLLRAAGGDRAGARSRRRGREQLLQVLLHDRLAARLDHRAALPDGRGGALPAEPLHLRADAVPTRRGGRLRLRRGARRPRDPLRRQPADSCWTALPPPASPTAPRPTAPSTSTPTCRT